MSACDHVCVCVCTPYSFHSKRQKGERHTDSRMSEESVDSSEQQSQPQTGYLLQADAGLWAHIDHARSNFQSLASVTDQVKQTAMSVLV